MCPTEWIQRHMLSMLFLSWTVLDFSAFPPNNQSAAAGHAAGQEHRGDHCSILANAGVVASLDEDDHREANPTGIQGHIVDCPATRRRDTDCFHA